MPAVYMTGFEIEADRPIWRYMSIDRLRSLIESASLYFASAREFEDQFEGSITVPEYKHRLRATSGLSTDSGLFEAHVSKAFQELTRLTKVNCWHQNDAESAAMWRLYLPAGKGIAVRSTVGNLMTSLREFRLRPEYGAETVCLGRVRYLDYRRERMADGSMLGRFFHKRASYVYENEVRAVLSLRMAEEYAVPVPKHGVPVPVDVAGLLQEVRVAPRLDDAVLEEIRGLVKTAGLRISVERSAEPVNRMRHFPLGDYCTISSLT